MDSGPLVEPLAAVRDHFATLNLQDVHPPNLNWRLFKSRGWTSLWLVLYPGIICTIPRDPGDPRQVDEANRTFEFERAESTQRLLARRVPRPLKHLPFKTGKIAAVLVQRIHDGRHSQTRSYAREPHLEILR